MQSLTLPASLESLSALRRFLAETSACIGRDDQAVYDLQLAVDEIATNAVHYGGADKRGPATFTLLAEKTPDQFTVTLEEYGQEFDPRTAPQHPPPGGWGVRLALEGVDRFDYQRDGERNRNIFVLKRARPLVVDLGNACNIVARLNELGYDAMVVHGDTPPAEPYSLVIFCPSAEYSLTAAVVKRFKGGVMNAVPALVWVEEVAGADKYLALGVDDVLARALPAGLLRARLRLWLDKKRLRDRSNAESRRLREAERLASDLKDVILPLGIALSAEKNFDALLEKILIEAQKICNADGGTLYLRTPDDCLTFTIVRNETLKLAMGGTTGNKITIPPLCMVDPKTGKPNLQYIAVYTAHHGRTVNIADTFTAQGFDFSGARRFDQANNYRTQSMLAIPLKDNEGATLGVLQLLNARDRESGLPIPFDGYVQEVAECLASQASVALSNQFLLQRQKALIQIENDLKIGRQLQENFLPSSLPQPAGWDVAAGFHPARAVSGDFYDAFWMSDTHLGLVIADVCNKGVGAALFMTLFRSLFRAVSQLTLTRDLSGLVGGGGSSDTATARRMMTLLAEFNVLSTVMTTNNYVAQTHAEAAMFATTFFAVLDVTTGTLIYVNGGHDAPVVVGENGVKHRLELTGPVVGMAPNTSYCTQKIVLEPGDLLFCYTDGVTEAHVHPGGPQFGEKGMLPLICQPAASSAEIVQRVDAALTAHYAGADPFDDITMLCVRRAK